MLGLNIPPPGPSSRSGLATDFGDYAIATVIGNGWTMLTGSGNVVFAVEADNGALSGKRMRVDKSSSNAARTAKWDAVGQVADIEVLCRIKMLQTPGGTDETTGQLVVRVDPSSDPYYVCLPNMVAGVKKFEIGRGDGAGGGARLGNVSKAWDATNWWWMRFRVISFVQRGRMWQHGTTEPTSWENDFIDFNVGGSGYMGFATYYTDASYAVDWVSVATGGRTAPGPNG